MRIERRLETPKRIYLYITAGSILASLFFVGVLLAIIGVNPVDAYSTMMYRAFATKFGVTELFVKTAPIILTGLAVSIPLRAGLWNIGAEGQLYMGAFAASVIALYLPIHTSAVVIPLMIIFAAFFGMVWASIPAFLKAKFDLNEIISTLLLNYVAIYWVEYLVYGPMKGKYVYNFPYSDLFGDYAILPRFFGTRFHLGVIIAFVVAILIYLLMMKTSYGFSVRIFGSNPRSAEYAGIKRSWVVVSTMLLAGMIAGLAGMIEVSGLHMRLRANVSPGYGYTGIPVALLARGNPLFVILSAFLFGWLYVGGSAMQTTFGIPVAIVDVFQALVVLFIIGGDFFTRYKIKLGGRS
ncbi:nucleoside ABC transporter membrane protein [Archaeoglobus sulfaticallidus PM70-1]|uniref:Nucleoside ABC transporter membrane protein n=1 Tax=Archaeoglobus sulfaticallidus PM70-1 TaxID=387631 RepID=N0BN68_9EURY|nr:ABC transporter permease [Archaeoglobus sulfaticallidus]AGK62056.1 nucleoside ABC transporter membrane protein [Archaeoglobus sulfaticallidus PM70-1]